MSWKDFLQSNKIGPMWHNVCFHEKDKIMKPEFRKSGISWAKKPSKSLIIHGKPGRGKTHFFYCLIREFFKTYDRGDMRFFKGKKLDDELLAEFNKYGTNTHMLESLGEVPFLFIEDFGVERASDRVERETYEIVDTRLEWRRPLVLNTNLTREELDKHYGKRILSRFKQYSWVHFDGPDLRGLL